MNPFIISDLSEADALRLNQYRDWVRGHFNHDPDQSYANSIKRLACIQYILNSAQIDGEDYWELEAMGVALGDSIAEELMLDWMKLEDKTGQDIVLNWPGTHLVCYPLTMISKRVGRGEQVDVGHLFDEVCRILGEMAFSGEYL